MTGKIMKGIAGFYYVDVEESGIYECKAKGIFRKEGQKPLVGDLVEIEILDEAEKTGNMTRILPRKNELIRPAVANIDQALVIFALENPTPNLIWGSIMAPSDIHKELISVKRRMGRFVGTGYS